MLLRGASAILSYALSIILARLLGAEEFGIYVYVMTWVSVLSIPATFGFDRLVVRELAVYNSEKRWSEVRGFLKVSIIVILTQSLVIMVLSYLILSFFIQISNKELYTSLLIGVLAVPFLGLINLGKGILRGIGRVVYSQMPNMFFLPFLMLVLLVTLKFIWNLNITAFNVIFLYIVASLITIILLVAFLKKYLPQEVFIDTFNRKYKIKQWMGAAFSFFVLSGMHIINSRTDIIMLGMFKTTADVGYYNVAARLSDVLTTVLLSVNGVIAPTISSLYSSGDKNKLQAFITKSSRLIFFLSLPVGIVLFFFGSWILRLYGKDFVEGLVVLRILLIAQFVNFSCGSVGLILNMTGNERITAFGFGVSALINVILNMFLIPIYGKEGAAVATGISIILWNITLFILIKKKLSLNTSAFSRIV